MFLENKEWQCSDGNGHKENMASQEINTLHFVDLKTEFWNLAIWKCFRISSAFHARNLTSVKLSEVVYSILVSWL
jgi:hypothetical protein